MNVISVAILNAIFVVRKFFGDFSMNTRQSTRLEMELLENRITPSGDSLGWSAVYRSVPGFLRYNFYPRVMTPEVTVETVPMQNGTVKAGATTPMAQVNISSAWALAHLSEAVFTAAAGSDTLEGTDPLGPNVIDAFLVQFDAQGEKLIGETHVQNGLLDFTDLNVDIGPNESVSFGLRTTVNGFTSAHALGVQLQQLDLIDWRKHAVPDKYVHYVSESPALFTVVHNDSDFGGYSVPSTVLSGEQFPVTISMKNTGDTTWVPGEYSLQNPGNVWGVTSVPLTSAVLPGQIATFSFTATAPVSISDHQSVWIMNDTETGLFGFNMAVYVSPPFAGSATIQMSGASQTYSPGSFDAVLGMLTFDTNGKTLDMQHMFIAIQGKDVNGNGLGVAISDTLQNVQLYNLTTGEIVDAILLTGGSVNTPTTTFQIYRFDGMTIHDDDRLNVRNDFLQVAGGHPMTGDTFTLTVGTDPYHSINGTTFGGLIQKSIAYQMTLVDEIGNVIDTIMPTNSIRGNPQYIAVPTLFVAQKSTGTSDTVVANQKNVDLMRFEMRADQFDVLVTSVTVSAKQGSLNNAQNYTLWVDTDGDLKVDTILNQGETAQNGKVTFNHMIGGGFVVPKGKTVVFEGHADIASSISGNMLQVQFDLSSAIYLQAEDVVNGNSIIGIRTDGVGSGDIIVTTTDTEVFTIKPQGDLYVTQYPFVVYQQFLGGTLGNPGFTLVFQAQYEDIDVTYLQISSHGNTASSVDHLELYVDSAITPFATATIGGTGSDIVPTKDDLGNTIVTFGAKMQSQQLIIPKGQQITVFVRPFIKTDVNGGVSGQPIQFWISGNPVMNNATGEGAVHARGISSSNNLGGNNGDNKSGGEVFIGTAAPGPNKNIIGPTNVTVLSKISDITNASPDADRTQVPTGVANIGQFTFSAAPNSNSKNGLNKVNLSGLIFIVDATNVNLDLNSFVLFNKTNSTVTTVGKVFDLGGHLVTTPTVTGIFMVLFENLTQTAVNVTIDQGTDITLVVQANILNSKVSATDPSSLQVSLDGIAHTEGHPFAVFGSHLLWQDVDSSSSTSFTWLQYPFLTVYSTLYQS